MSVLKEQMGAEYELQVNYLDDSGVEQEVYGDSLREIQEALATLGYEGPKLRVWDLAGQLYGYADAKDYRST